MKILSEYRTPEATEITWMAAEALLAGSTDPTLDLDSQDMDYEFGGDW